MYLASGPLLSVPGRLIVAYNVGVRSNVGRAWVGGCHARGRPDMELRDERWDGNGGERAGGEVYKKWKG